MLDKPKVVASLPVRKPEDLSNIEEIESDLIELRLDYSSNPFFIIDELDKFSSLSSKLIFTIRDVNEGGINQVSPDVKKKIYDKIYDNGFIYDVEAKFAKRYEINVDCRTILSLHYFSNVPSLEEVVELFEPFKGKDPLFKVAIIGKGKYKEVLSSLLSLKKVAVMPMGVDPLERIAFGILGSRLIYASVIESTAPGQMNYREVKRTLDCIFRT